VETVVCGSGDPKHAIRISVKDLLAQLGEHQVENFTVANAKRQDDGRRRRILTGDRPTGRMHIGHLAGTLENRVKLQDEYEQFILMANIHALSDNTDDPQKVRDGLYDLLCDYYAAGIDFEKTTVYIQSEVPVTHEIFMYLSNFATVQQIQHNPTIKTELKQNGMEDSTPLGFFIYGIHQAADILLVNADLVPVGRDQAPMVEDTRELARKFNNAYGKKVLNEPEALFGVAQNVPGIDGQAKMGKSLNNAIYLGDSEEELRKKVFSVYTDPNRKKATDPGTIEGNVAFTYHDLFNDNKEEVEDLKKRYVEGKVGDVEVKEKLFVAMNKKLTPIRERRKEAEQMKEKLFEYALAGSKKVSEIGRGIADQMKDAMKILF
jgi:tryptophanyl-tRNA synthetase